MDPRLTETMMNDWQLPNLQKLSRRAAVPARWGPARRPKSPVAWAISSTAPVLARMASLTSFTAIPDKQCEPFYSAAETLPGHGGLNVGEHKNPAGVLALNIKLHQLCLIVRDNRFGISRRRKDSTTFYDLPSTTRLAHRGMASPLHLRNGNSDMLGGYGKHQYFAENNPADPVDEGAAFAPGSCFRIHRQGHSRRPRQLLSGQSQARDIELLVHRDRAANAGAIEFQGQTLMHKAGQWSNWTKLDSIFDAGAGASKTVTGICRFYLQEVSPNFKLYVSPSTSIPPTRDAIS